MIKRQLRAIDRLLQRQQTIQRVRIHRHACQRLSPGVAALLGGQRIMLTRYSPQQLMQPTGQSGLIAIVPMLEHESVEFSQHLCALPSRLILPPPKPSACQQ